MNQYRLAAFLVSAILACLVGTAELQAQAEGPARAPTETLPDISGEWVATSPLDYLVQDDSAQPINTFRIERSGEGNFDARYLGSRSTGVRLKWVEKTRQFEGSRDFNRGKATFIVTPAEDPNVLNCKIEFEKTVGLEISEHKDTWTRTRKSSQTPKFTESTNIILTEMKDGLVAYNKLNGNWAKIDIAAPTDGTTRLKCSTLSPSFVSAMINGELLGYCNRVSRWSKLSIPAEDLQTIKVNHTSSAVSATIGDKLYILSAATGDWETAEAAQVSSERSASDVKPGGIEPRSGVSFTNPYRVELNRAASDAQALQAAERYSNALKNTNAADPSAVKAKLELERVLDEAFDLKLKIEQERIADLKQRVRRLEQQIEQRIANRTSVIRRRIDELTESVEKTAKEMEQTGEKPKQPVVQIQTPILRYEETSDLTGKIKNDIEAVLMPFEERLKKLGFKLEKGQVVLRLQPGMNNAHYFQNNRSIVMDPRVIGDNSVMRREYTHHALAVALGADSQEIFEKCAGIESGLSDYFGCSSCDEPVVGREFMAALRAFGGGNALLRTMDNQRRFSEVTDNSGRHDIGEVLSGALWEMRTAIGKNELDPLLYKAWVAIVKFDDSKGQIVRFAISLLDAAKTENPDYAKKIRAILESRGLTLP